MGSASHGPNSFQFQICSPHWPGSTPYEYPSQAHSGAFVPGPQRGRTQHDNNNNNNNTNEPLLTYRLLVRLIESFCIYGPPLYSLWGAMGLLWDPLKLHWPPFVAPCFGTPWGALGLSEGTFGPPEVPCGPFLENT